MSWGGDFGGGWGQYVSAAEKKKRAEAQRRQLAARTKDRALAPVEFDARVRPMASSVWGRAWCANLESYAELANRLERGRAYARSGAILDLAVEPGVARAWISGSELYRVEVRCKPVAAKDWAAMRKALTGQIDSLLSLFGGELAAPVMNTVSRREGGLFPSPAELAFACTCPDQSRAGWMCKHVAATLYGLGRRLDAAPQLLFTLRQTNPQELVATTAAALAKPPATSAKGDYPRLDEAADLSALFGIELADPATPYRKKPAKKRPKTSRGRT